MAVGIGAERVDLDFRADRVSGVVADIGHVLARIAFDLADRLEVGNRKGCGKLATRAVGAGDAGEDAVPVGVIVIGVIGAEIEIAVAPERRRHAAAEVVGEPILNVGCTFLRIGGAPVVGVLEDDVDDASDRVRPVLGGRTVTQHLDVVDQADRDHVEIDRV